MEAVIVAIAKPVWWKELQSPHHPTKIATETIAVAAVKSVLSGATVPVPLVDAIQEKSHVVAVVMIFGTIPITVENVVTSALQASAQKENAPPNVVVMTPCVRGPVWICKTTLVTVESVAIHVDTRKFAPKVGVSKLASRIQAPAAKEAFVFLL